MFVFSFHFLQLQTVLLLIDTTPSTPSSDEDTLVSGQQSPSREVSPKFIVGGKKYGRRSRPQSASFDSQSDSDNEYLTQNDQQNSNTMKSQKVSTSIELKFIYYVVRL